VPFGPDRLQHRGTQPRVLGDQVGHPPNSLHVWIGASVVDDVATADHIIGDNQTPFSGESECPLQILGVTLFVRVDEGEVERSSPLRHELGEDLQPRSDSNFHLRGEPGSGEVRSGDLRVLRIQFDGEQSTLRRKSPSEPDGAVSSERPDFEDLAGSLEFG